MTSLHVIHNRTYGNDVVRAQDWWCGLDDLDTAHTADEPNTNPTGQDGTEYFWGLLYSDPRLSLQSAGAAVQIELKEFEKYHKDPKGGLTGWLTDWQIILETHVYTDGRPLDVYQIIHGVIENNYTFLLYTCAFLAEALDLKYSAVLLAQDVKKKRIQHNPATGQMSVTICSLIQDKLFEISKSKPGATVPTPSEMVKGILVKAQQPGEIA